MVSAVSEPQEMDSPAPPTVILTEEGASALIQRNYRLRRFRLLNGREEYGLQVDPSDLVLLTSMLNRGLVRRVQGRFAHVVSQRKAVSHLVTTIATGFFVRHLAAAFRARVADTEEARKWNRAHPRALVGSTEAAAVMTRYLADHQAEVDTARGEIRAAAERQALRGGREGGGASTPRSTAEVGPRLDTVLRTIPEELWFFLASSQKQEARARLTGEISMVVLDGVARLELADYLAVMWIELLTHMQELSGDAREEVGLLAQFNARRVDGRTRPAESHQLHMVAASGSHQMRLLKNTLADVGDVSSAQSISRFYHAAGTDQSGLGLFYLGFTEEACRRAGVGFRSFVQESDGSGALNVVIST